MKKITLLAIAAILGLTACQKEVIPATDPVFKATIDASKTAIDALTGAVSWVEGDEVSITDGASHSAIYTATDVNGASATLVKKSGDTLGDGPYTALYGEDPSTAQTYSASVPSLPMSAESNDHTFSFEVTCGLLELTVTQSGESLKSISTSNGTATYTLECTPLVSIATGNVFYIALPAGSYTSFKFVNAANKVCRFKLKDGKSFTISANKIHPLAFTSNLTFCGEFSVAADKKVRFSRGNLQYQASSGNWRFAANQYDFIGDFAGNNTASDRNTQTDWIDLFGFGATGQKDINANLSYPYETVATDTQYKTIEGEANGSETLTRNNGGDWGVCMGEGWRLLASDEWTYLMANHTHNNIYAEVSSGVYVHGVMVMPDGWSGKLVYNTDNDTWRSLESSGGVFFPSAGFRQGTTVVNSGTNGYYWSSNVNSNKDGKGLFIKEGTQGSNAANGIPRRYGASVRLVMEVPAE